MPTLDVEKGEGVLLLREQEQDCPPLANLGMGEASNKMGARQWTTQHTAALSKSHRGRQECNRWGRPGTSGHQECSSANFVC